MSVAMIGPKFYAWGKDGKPLAFGKLYTFQARTNNPKDTYKTEDQVTTNTNPVTLNGEGYADVYLSGSYKMVLKDSDENEIWTSDPVSSAQPSEWALCLTTTYLSSTSSKVNGNFTAQYEVGRRVRINNNSSNYSYSTIISSTFAAGETVIVISEPFITTGVLEICVSVVGQNSMPDQEPNSVSALKTLNVPVGATISTKGYYYPGDGGKGDYLIKTVAQAATDGDFIGSFGNHALSSGDVAILQTDSDGSVNAFQYGAKHGIANDSYLQLTEFLSNAKVATMSKSDFYVSQTVVFDNNNLKFTGVGYTGSNIITLAGFTGTHILKSDGFGLKMEKIRLLGNGGAFGAGATIRGLELKRSDLTGNVDSFITDCQFSNVVNGIDTHGRNTVIKDCNFSTSLGGVEQFASPEGETRGLVVSDNNFHSMGNIGTASTCIKVNTISFGNSITDNVGDGSVYNFYSGPTQGSTITDNNISTLVNDGVVSQGTTYVGLPLSGILSGNNLSKGAPSYIGTCIKGQFNNTTIDNNTCVGSAEHGIYVSSGGGNTVTNNLILSHDFTDTGNFDGIKCDGTSNLVESNHIRSAGKLTVNSAINMSISAGILGNNFVDSAYVTPYGGKQPDFNLTSAGAGFGITPDTDLHVAGFESKITSPDAIKANPVKRTAEHTGGAGVFAGAEVRSVVISSAVGNEAVDGRITVNNRTVIEDRIIAFFDGGMGLQSPDGTWYKLQPPNGGGSIAWVATPYVP